MIAKSLPFLISFIPFIKEAFTATKAPMMCYMYKQQKYIKVQRHVTIPEFLMCQDLKASITLFMLLLTLVINGIVIFVFIIYDRV